MDPQSETGLPCDRVERVSPVDVAAGLIFSDGKLLIAQRHPDTHLGGLWEFPGGKRESGETFGEALVRELQEELGVTVCVGELIEAVDHAYPDKVVHIRFFRCRIIDGSPRALGCHALKWIGQDQLRAHPFPHADAHLLDRLAGENEWWGSAASC
jgi:mutator protein MutT